MDKEFVKECIKEMFKNGEIDINEVDDKAISKNKLIKHLRELEKSCKELSQGNMFWNNPGVGQQFWAEAECYSCLINIIESGKFDKCK